jgi:WD40 repeat protein
MAMHLSETDASLLSWLHALPIDTFSCPFEEKPLKLNMDRFVKPNLEATWADSILATPIKPQQLFPYNAVPSGRSRNTELMSRSLAPQYEGLSFGLSKSQIFTSGIEMKLNTSKYHHQNNNNSHLNDVTRSIALFNLIDDSNGINPNSILTASLYNNSNQCYPTILNGIKEEAELATNTHSAMTGSSSSSSSSSASSSNSHSTNNSLKPNNKSKPKSVAAPKSTSPTLTISKQHQNPITNSMQDSTLFKEYQKNKAQIILQLEEQEKKRDEFVKQLKTPNVYNALNAVSKSQNTKNSYNHNNNNNESQIISPNDLTLTTNNLVDDDESFLSPHSAKRTFVNSNSNANLSTKYNGESATSPSNQHAKSPVSPPLPNTNRTVNSPRPNKTAASSEPKTTLSFNKNNNSDNSINRDESSSSKSKRAIIDATLKFETLEEITRAASFQPVCIIEDQQAIRAVDIHPSGNYYVVGSNSKCLRICPYPNLTNITADTTCKGASVLYKKGKHHYGSIYCTAWNPSGNLIATGSNDKTIKLVKFSPDLAEDTESEVELTYHNGTIRDLIFMQQEDNNILISGGAGDCKIQVLDCQTQQSLRSYTGHTGHIYTLFTWAGTKNVFVSGSQDKTCRFWDLRAPEAIQTITPSTTLALQGSPVAAVAVDPSGLLLSTGHEDAACCLYDIRGSRIVQIYKPHTSDIRSVRFSANAYYLLTASYDNKVIITDLHGDLTKPLNWSIVAQHSDKIIQARWHPTQMSFITTSADRTSVVWSLPSDTLANASVV